MKVNIIGDIAGRYDELIALIAKMPKADLILSVGDMVDRGPKSRQVIEYFMQPGREALLGNHEVMGLEAYRNYPGAPHEHPYWTYNGGGATMDSYLYATPPEAHLRWLEARPIWYKSEGLFVSHAPVRDVAQIPPQYTSWENFIGDESTFVWNRYLSRRPMPGHHMVYGHNSHYEEDCWVDDDGVMQSYATCIDNSRHKELMGMHWDYPNRSYYKVDYVG